MQQMRMSIYDLSDVAYDAYLLNGRTQCDPWIAPVQIGDTVRLRFIGAAGSTIYHVKIPGTKMQMVHVQGNNVQSYWIDDFWIAPGETYDVLVRIENPCPYIIYAESIDTLGKAYGALVSDPTQPIAFQQVTPFVQKASQIWVTKDLGPLSKIYVDHCIQHQQRHHENITFTGIENWRKYIEQFLAEYPDYQEKIIFQLAEGNKVVSMLDCHASTIYWSGIMIDRIEHGKIHETWTWFKRNK